MIKYVENANDAFERECCECWVKWMRTLHFRFEERAIEVQYGCLIKQAVGWTSKAEGSMPLLFLRLKDLSCQPTKRIDYVFHNRGIRNPLAI
jgi:hypothetical protein